MKNLSESIGIVVPSEKHGNVKIIGFNQHESWGGKVHIYLGKASNDTFIGSFQHLGTLTGGALIVEKTDDPVTTFVN
ncbi:hypothetical protein D3C74_91510 [compost metagenome]